MNALGEFLRARRDLVTPEQAGVPVLGPRRVSGLRREEVAMLAGISADYYLRLERGRDRRPSVQVLESLARVLHLDDDARAHLFALGTEPASRRRRRRRESAPPSTAALVSMLGLPAFIEGRCMDVLAANPQATALSPRLRVGGNRLRDLILEPEEQAMFGVDWERAAAALVGGFRDAIGTDAEDERVVELVGELSLASPVFRRLWARHDVVHRAAGVVPLTHPQLGELTLNREKLLIAGTAGIMLVIYHPAGAADAEKLGLLATLASSAGR